jgi:hypothetical protein
MTPHHRILHLAGLSGDQLYIWPSWSNTVTIKLIFFRTGVIQLGCPTCRQKRDNPEKKIYTERTIEMGIITDSYFWENMKVNKIFSPFYTHV